MIIGVIMVELELSERNFFLKGQLYMYFVYILIFFWNFYIIFLKNLKCCSNVSHPQLRCLCLLPKIFGILTSFSIWRFNRVRRSSLINIYILQMSSLNWSTSLVIFEIIFIVNYLQFKLNFCSLFIFNETWVLLH